MSKKILFSPIGGTDPIKYLRDGSMLHICRHYKPDVVYLYLSHEMLEYHKKDNRYVGSIAWLGKYLNHSFDVRLIERSDLYNVHEYDVFYQDFKEEIGKIESGMEPGDELLLNMASGTPAMKSALLVMATFAEYRFRAIQVSSPLRRINEKHEDRKEFDGEINCELNEDNAEDAENRCQEVKCLGLMRLLKTEIIKKHILAYDYTAALAVASEIPHELSENAYTMLKIAAARIKLNLKKVNELIGDKPYQIYPVKDGDKRKIFEYALVLWVKVEREEYADFIRGITPLVIDVLELIMKKVCGVKLENCCEDNQTKGLKWDRKKLDRLGLLQILEDEYRDRGGFRAGVVYSTHVGTLIRAKSTSEVLKKKIEEITEIEGKLRNVAAHKIVSVTEQWFVEETGKGAKQIYELLKYLIKEAGVNAKKEDWQSYGKMNEEIVRYLDEPV